MKNRFFALEPSFFEIFQNEHTYILLPWMIDICLHHIMFVGRVKAFSRTKFNGRRNLQWDCARTLY